MEHYSGTTRHAQVSWNKTSAPRTVHKYSAPCFNKVLTLPLPKGATVLSAVIMNKELCVYAEVDLEERTDMDYYQFQAVGTGYTIDIGYPRFFLGTVLLPLSPTYAEVYHVYYCRH